jgi:hypothetical protein
MNNCQISVKGGDAYVGLINENNILKRRKKKIKMSQREK